MSIFYYYQPSLFSELSDSVPSIAECIDELAKLVEQQNPDSICWPASVKTSMRCPPRLTFDQLNQATQDYPYQLPLEVQILYQKCNGCFPIGTDRSKNWDSFDSYCDFRFPHTLFHPLLGQCVNGDRPYWDYIDSEWYDSRFFPISNTDQGDYVVVGSTEQKVASPVLFIEFDGDNQRGSVRWSSLTDMFLTEIRYMREALMA